jgi:ribosomal protein S18 acetylase RimI-like enzyme
MSTMANQPDMLLRSAWNIEVEEPSESQVPEILEVWKEFIDLHALHDPYYRRCEDCERGMSDFIHRCLGDPNLMIRTAKHESRVIGYVIGEVVRRSPCFITSEFGSIIDLAVKHEHRRRGVGEALYAEALDWMRMKGVKRVELKVSTGNENAEAFWTKQGFREHLRTFYLDL